MKVLNLVTLGVGVEGEAIAILSIKRSIDTNKSLVTKTLCHSGRDDAFGEQREVVCLRFEKVVLVLHS